MKTAGQKAMEINTAGGRNRRGQPRHSRFKAKAGAIGEFDGPLRRKESACKPGSVGDSHSSGMRVTAHLKRPTRKPCGPHVRHKSACFPIWSCSGWGFPCRGRLPAARCALTAPFHPCRRLRAWAVCFLWHCPWARAPQALPGILSCGARTFLGACAPRLSGRLRSAQYAMRPA